MCFRSFKPSLQPFSFAKVVPFRVNVEGKTLNRIGNPLFLQKMAMAIHCDVENGVL